MTPVAWVVLGFIAGALTAGYAVALGAAAKRGDEHREWADYTDALEEHYRRERAINRLIADSQRPS